MSQSIADRTSLFTAFHLSGLRRPVAHLSSIIVGTVSGIITVILVRGSAFTLVDMLTCRSRGARTISEVQMSQSGFWTRSYGDEVEMQIFVNIVVAYERSLGSERALTLAAQLDEVDDSVRAGSEYFAERQHRALQVAECYGVASRRAIMQVGRATRANLETAAQRHADLLALGRGVYSTVWERLMASTADKIARRAACSVLIAS
jgi:nucleotide-binding universal stress UspA family protein